MDNKLSELRRLTPRQIAVYRDRVAISDSDYELIPVHTGDLRALLAELEAKDKSIAELEAEAKVWESAATKHLARAEEAEKRLATPVRLKKVDSSNVPFAGDGFNAAVDYCAKAVLAAGFTVTVEGDEQ
ncbi:hypothetical protein EFZ62_16170 [Serratia marcescens]|uniref:hypothetical protein n=1 Tax=Serratia marcescens TaxID=615 RepID=UPI001318E66B|nr:hypothetical protein [Serratia marcescens]QHC46416.1 hypothetical protein EFZ62_16170 [Serratia marcescens]